MSELKITGMKLSGEWPDTGYWLKSFGIALLVVVIVYILLKVSLYYFHRVGTFRVISSVLIAATIALPTYAILSWRGSLKVGEWQENNNSSSIRSTAGTAIIDHKINTVGLQVLSSDEKLATEIKIKLQKALVEEGFFKQIVIIDKSSSFTSFNSIDMILKVIPKQLSVIEKAPFTKQTKYTIKYEFQTPLKMEEYNGSAPYGIMTMNLSDSVKGESKISGIASVKQCYEQTKNRAITSVIDNFTEAYKKECGDFTKKYVTDVISTKDIKAIINPLSIPKNWEILSECEYPGLMFPKRYEAYALVPNTTEKEVLTAIAEFVYKNNLIYDHRVNKSETISKETIIENKYKMLRWRKFGDKERTKLMHVDFFSEDGEVGYFGSNNEPQKDLPRNFYVKLNLYDSLSPEEKTVRQNRLLIEFMKNEMYDLAFSLTQTSYGENKKERYEVLCKLVELFPENESFFKAKADDAEGQERVELMKQLLDSIPNGSQYYRKRLDMQIKVADAEEALLTTK